VANLGALLLVTIDVVLPVLLIASVGFVARSVLRVDPRVISRLALYVMVPALLFNSLLTTKIGGDEIARIALFMIALTAILIFVAVLLTRLFGLPRAMGSGITMAIAFMNSANYGLPVTLFAFGPEGFDRAVIFAAFSAILTYSVALFVAAHGRLAWRQAIVPVLQIPVVWAGVAAGVIRGVGVPLPDVIQRAVTLLSQGTVPIIILLLGMQVAGLSARHIRGPAFLAIGARLLLSPIIGLGLVALLRPDPLTAKILVLESAMPTAVNVALLAAEFDAEPQLVSSIVVITTVLSIFTVAGWVAFLQNL